MKIISFDDISKLNISPVECYNLVEKMIENKKSAILPPKISMKPINEVFCNVMPCIINKDKDKDLIGAVKVVTRYPNRNPSLDSKILLFNGNSGEMLSLMDGDWITTMRTGAVAVHSIKLLAKSNFKNIGIMGLGNTARATILILSELLPDREFNIKLLKYKDQEVLFTERFKNNKNLHFEYVDSYEKLLKNTEVLISAVTYLEEDVCKNELFEKGILVVPIHTRGFTNCDLFFDKVYADDYGHVCHFKNFDKFKYFSEVCDVINGTKKGRENNDERILAYNIGLSIHDAYFASYIYDKVFDNENLLNIDFKEPNEKFWI